MIEEQSKQASLSDVDVEEIAEQFRALVDIRDRIYGFPKKSISVVLSAMRRWQG